MREHQTATKERNVTTERAKLSVYNTNHCLILIQFLNHRLIVITAIYNLNKHFGNVIQKSQVFDSIRDSIATMNIKQSLQTFHVIAVQGGATKNYFPTSQELLQEIYLFQFSANYFGLSHWCLSVCPAFVCHSFKAANKYVPCVSGFRA